MQQLSQRKRIAIVKSYLRGLSYQEIARRVGVSKGSVANVISDLKAGRFPEAGDLSEQVDILRELSVDLRRAGVTPAEAMVGLAVLGRLQELDIDPGDIGRLAAMCRELAGGDVDVRAFVKAAFALEEARQRTGLGLLELEGKVQSLRQEVEQLEPRLADLRPQIEQVQQKEARLIQLQQEVAAIIEVDSVGRQTSSCWSRHRGRS